MHEVCKAGMSDNGAKPEGWKVPFAQAVKEVVRIPVAASGSLRHPAYVEGIIAVVKVWLRRGCADDIEMIADIIETCVHPEGPYGP